MIIAVDAGKHSTKAVCKTTREEKYIMFRTKVEEQGVIITQDGTTFSVEYNGQKYTIGEGANISDYDTTKAKLCHKLTTYTAIALLLSTLGNGYENGVSVDLVTGCPISKYINKETRQEYQNFIAGDKNIGIKINNKNYSFKINSVLVLPESIGVVMQNANEFLDAVIAVVDIGGLNTNSAVYSSLRPLKNTVFTINEGGEIINTKIKKALNTALNTNYQDYEIPHLKLEGEIKHIVERILNNQIEVIISECKKNNWNTNALQFMFTGGGSQILERQIRSNIPNAKISKTPVWDNVRGFLQIKEMYS